MHCVLRRRFIATGVEKVLEIPFVLCGQDIFLLLIYLVSSSFGSTTIPIYHFTLSAVSNCEATIQCKGSAGSDDGTYTCVGRRCYGAVIVSSYEDRKCNPSHENGEHCLAGEIKSLHPAMRFQRSIQALIFVL